MQEYEVKITEILEKVVCVTAENVIDAEEQVQDAWDNGDYVLDADNFVTATFEVSERKEC